MPDDQEEQKPYPLNGAINSRKMVDNHCNNFSPSHPTVVGNNRPALPRQIDELPYLKPNVAQLRIFCSNIIESLTFRCPSNLWIREREPLLHSFAWQAGYGMFSVSPGDLDAVRLYISSQESHHRKISFQDELRQMFQQYSIEWDERYVWD